MSNPMTAVRAALTEVLEDAGVRVLPEVPNTFSPPICWAAPRSPYCQPGQAFGQVRVAVSVICVAAQGTSSAALEAVEELTWEVRALLDAADNFRLDPEEQIGVPVLYASAQGQGFLGAPVNVFVDVAPIS